ncbi:fibrinogen-like protein 1 isoform X1 [Drosophila sulfurigaster albostrigata]|uniref:fibrinogen-like protein 1 isoform X1 n=2 Tax=Drosophila sulfurigaster albostrigata TaxID=89887 RepID=UPI002D21DDE3|nr:fibrinogen-like protein 1 isoform X1 [Drosophila sulfurigaster albostrigata]
MFVKIASIILILNFSVLKCEEEQVHTLEKLGTLKIKYGNTTEINFQIKDPSIKLLQAQLEALQAEQIKMFTELNAKIDKISTINFEKTNFASSCAEATALSRRSGVYQIRIPDYSPYPFMVSCDEDSNGGGWTIVLRREDGSVNFYRNWKDYKQGFGNMNGEFFIGLEKLHMLTKEQDQELLFLMENSKGETKFAKYDQFAIGSEKNLYALQTLGEYSGDAGDSFSGQMSYKFSARDRDNDVYTGNCALEYRGGWWYNKCHGSNLMGIYNETTYGKGVMWNTFSGLHDSLKMAKMMIRPRR